MTTFVKGNCSTAVSSLEKVALNMDDGDTISIVMWFWCDVYCHVDKWLMC